LTGRRISRAKLKAAITNSGGIITQVCKASGYTWAAVRDFIQADPELAQMLADEEARIDDLAEAQVIKAISEGDMQTARWWLARRRRQRYGDQVDITNRGEVTLRVVYEDTNT